VRLGDATCAAVGVGAAGVLHFLFALLLLPVIRWCTLYTWQRSFVSAAAAVEAEAQAAEDRDDTALEAPEMLEPARQSRRSASFFHAGGRGVCSILCRWREAAWHQKLCHCRVQSFTFCCLSASTCGGRTPNLMLGKENAFSKGSAHGFCES
jgi:hypothetical protein